VFGVNRIRLDWKMLPVDRRTVVRAEEIVDAELRRLGIGELEPLPPELVESWPDNLEGGWHQLGMTRMDPDPRRGVVNTDGRLHEVGNLFVTGGSVFPTVGAAPPTLTIVAMALRLADHLRAVLGKTDADIGGTRMPVAALAPTRVLPPLELPLDVPTAARMG
jgi:choline dehydrogenase-like flavoprotein